jgi:hypothetical protein
MRHYLAQPHEEPVDLTDAEVERIFVDWDGTPRERLHLAGMTEEQRTAFGQWAASTGVTRASDYEEDTPLQYDIARLHVGFHDATSLTNQHGGG